MPTLAIIGAETVHGVLRGQFLVPLVGDLRARPIGVFTGSLLIFGIAWLSIRWIRARTTRSLLAVGAAWLAFTWFWPAPRCEVVRGWSPPDEPNDRAGKFFAARPSSMNPFKLVKSMFVSAPRFAATDCFARVRSGAAMLIDVRERHEWEGGVAERAILLPLSDLTGGRAQWRPFLAAHAGRELLLYCGQGVRSGMAARVLASEGFRAANAGSFAEWSAAGWPVVPPATAS